MSLPVHDAGPEAGGAPRAPGRRPARDPLPRRVPTVRPEPPRPEPEADAAAPPMRAFRGIPVSPGLAIGPVVVVDPRGLRLPPRSIAPAAVPAELARLDAALADA